MVLRTVVDDVRGTCVACVCISQCSYIIPASTNIVAVRVCRVYHSQDLFRIKTSTGSPSASSSGGTRTPNGTPRRRLQKGERFGGCLQPNQIFLGSKNLEIPSHKKLPQ